MSAQLPPTCPTTKASTQFPFASSSFQFFFAMKTTMLASITPSYRMCVHSSSRGRLPTSPPRLTPKPTRTTHSTRIFAFKEDDETKDPLTRVPRQPSSSLAPIFSRRRENFLGKAASFGVVASWIGELMTGMGPVHQLSYELGISVTTTYALAGALAIYQFVGGINPFSPTWSRENQMDVASATKSSSAYTTTGPSLSTLIGRAAMLVFAASVIGEFMWAGESPLVHAGLVMPGVYMGIFGAPWWFKLVVGVFLGNTLGLFPTNSNNY